MREITIEDKGRLDALRRKARRHGMRLEKSRERSTHSNNRGGLMLIRDYGNTVLAGINYDLDLDDAAYWIDRYAAEQA